MTACLLLLYRDNYNRSGLNQLNGFWWNNVIIHVQHISIILYLKLRYKIIKTIFENSLSNMTKSLNYF